MNKEVDFFFPEDVSDEWAGFNDPGMEHFSGNPYVHVGKEVPQNSLDARTADPVKLNIQILSVPTDSIPGIESLRLTMSHCQAGASLESDKAKIFFDNAVKLLNKQEVTVLKISDENTTGVEGPCENGKPYFAFVKAIGQSKKSSDAGLGSFGIGKFAPFTVSELRTMFISTVWQAQNRRVHYVQGKAILMSHKNSEKTHKAIGYWGIKDHCQPVEGTDHSIPNWLERKELGTTLAILGFKAVNGWEKLLAASIAQNYFGAIAEGRLEVRVNNIDLSKHTLNTFFKDAEVADVVKESQKEPEQFNEAGLFLSTINNDQGVVVEETENLHLGNCELRIRVAERLPKKVAFLRDGMFITSDLNGLKRFTDYKDFVAVFICKSQKGNALLRAMEPPRHDDFEPQRLDLATQKKAKKALKDVSQWVREMLKRHARDPVSEETTIDELANYFGDEEQGEPNKNSRSRDINPQGQLLIRARPIKFKPVSTWMDGGFEEGEDNDGGGSDKGGEGGAGVAGSEDGSGRVSGNSDGDDRDGRSEGKSNDSMNKNLSSVALENVRAIPLNSQQRQLSFTTRHSGNIVLNLEISGADNNERLKIVATSLGKVNDNNTVELEVISGERFSIKVTLDRPFTGSVRISAYAI